jgi:hypothetical protein
MMLQISQITNQSSVMCALPVRCERDSIASAAVLERPRRSA